MAEYINKYTDNAAYVADASGRASLGKSTVSLEDDTRKVHFDGVNVEIPEGVVPGVGSVLWVDGNGGKHFYKGDTVNHTALTAKGQTFVGTVAISKGRKAWVLHKEESTDIRFTSCWAWEVIGLTYGSSNTIVFQQVAKTDPYGKVTVGTCTFTPSDIDDAVDKLDTWLRANPGDTSTCYEYNWHCTKIDGRIWVIADFGSSPSYRQYTALHGSGTTSGVATNTNMWTLAGYGTDYTQTQRADGKVGGTTLGNTSRAKQYMASSGNLGTPTDTNPDDSSGIYAESNFTAANCPNTYSKYNGDYDAYLDSKLIKYPSSVGAMSVYAGDGRRANDAIASVSYVPLAGGNAVKMFTAVDYAKQRKAHSTASVAGLNAGDWYLPGYDEIFGIFKDMKTDGSDKVNAAFVQSNGSARSLSVNRWVPARYYSHYAWFLNTSGLMNGGSFNATLRACAVALLEF